MANSRSGKTEAKTKETIEVENRLIIILIMVAVVIAMAIILVFALKLSSFAGPTPVTVIGLNVYTGVKSGNNTFNRTNAYSAFYRLKTSSTFTPTFVLSSPFYYGDITVKNISIITPGFKLNSVYPKPPFNLSVGSNITVVLNATSPSTPFSGILSLRVLENSSYIAYNFSYNINKTAIITGINLSIVYQNTTAPEYFGSTNQSLNASIFLAFASGVNGTFSVPMTFRNGDVHPHAITGVKANTPGFRIYNATPTLPYEISANQTLPMEFYLETSNGNFTGPISITVYTR